jgi:flagellar hook-associated protein FlgK
LDACVIGRRPCIVECSSVNVMSIASSGMRAASLGAQAAAANVARLPVEGSSRIGVAQTSVVGGGVEAGVVEDAPDPGAPVSDLLAAKEAVLAFTANATLIRRSDQMLGALLDEQA